MSKLNIDLGSNNNKIRNYEILNNENINNEIK